MIIVQFDEAQIEWFAYDDIKIVIARVLETQFQQYATEKILNRRICTGVVSIIF